MALFRVIPLYKQIRSWLYKFSCDLKESNKNVLTALISAQLDNRRFLPPEPVKHINQFLAHKSFTCCGMERFKIWLIRAIIRANSSGARRPSSWVGNSFSYLQFSPNIVTSPIPFKTWISGFSQRNRVFRVKQIKPSLVGDAFRVFEWDYTSPSSPTLQFRPFLFFSLFFCQL